MLYRTRPEPSCPVAGEPAQVRAGVRSGVGSDTVGDAAFGGVYTASMRTVLVTGANSGIGYATALALARNGYRIIAAGRTEERAVRAARLLAAESRHGSIVPVWGDFRSLTEVRALAGQVLHATETLHVLVNNAGRLSLRGREVTEDGNMLRLQVNYLAPFLLTHLLLPALANAPRSRIVNVSSASHKLGGPIDLSDLQASRSYHPFKVFCTTKAMINLFTVELARRYAGDGITANVLHPGIVRSNVGGRDRARGFDWLLAWLAQPFMLSVDEGARTSVYLASSPEVEGVSGVYFAGCRPAKAAPFSVDPVTAERLWDATVGLLGLAAAPFAGYASTR